MKSLIGVSSRIALIASIASLAAPVPTLATDFVVPSGTTDTSQKVLNGVDTLTVQANGTLSTTADPSVLSNNTSTNVIITNSGTIQSTATGARAIRFANGGSGAGATTRNFTINNNVGSIIQSQNDVLNVQPNVTAGTIVVNNAGIMRSIGTGANNGQAIDFNNFTGAGTASVTINNFANGVMTAADADAIRPGNKTVVNNFGQIAGHNAPGNTGADGVDFQTFGGTVNNMAGGTITGDRHGITGDQPVNVTNAGTITGLGGSGINLDTAANTTTIVTNTGTIVGNAVGADGDGIDVDGLIALRNSGTIRAVGTFAGEINEAVAIGGGTIQNDAGRLITSVQRAITVDDSNLGNAFAAVTIINDGTIQGDSGEAIRITSTFANTLTNRGIINGSVVMGGGNDTVNLVTGSTLNGLLDGGAGVDSLSLQGTGSGSLSNVVNFENLNVQSGTWTLTDTQTYANGATVSSGATLNANGTLGNLVTVSSGGRLGGTGTVGAIAAAGTVAPGPGIATLSVSGSVNFASGSTYEVDATAAGQADRINAASATLGGGKVQVLAAGGAYAPSTSYTILSTTGSVSGQFATVTSNLAFLNPSLSYTANSVILQLARNGTFFGQVAQNSNQANVARVLDVAPTDSALFLAVVNQSASGAQQAFTALSHEVATAGPNASLQATGTFLSMMVDPAMRGGNVPSLAGGSAVFAYAGTARKKSAAADAFAAYYKAPPAPTPFEARWRSWAAASGTASNVSGDAAVGSHDLDVRSAALTGGLDYLVGLNTTIGFAVSGATGQFRVSDGLGSGHADTLQGGVYGSTWLNNMYVSAAAAFAVSDIDTNATVSFPGVFAQYHSSPEAKGIGGRLEGGWRQVIAPGVGVTPYAALQAQSVRTPGYANSTVNGPGTFALNYNAQTFSRSRSELGIGIDGRIGGLVGQGIDVFARAAWAHNFARDTSISAAFQTLPGTIFTVTGAEPAADAALIKIGADVAVAANVRVGTRFEGEFGKNSDTYSGTGFVRVAW